MLRVRIFQVEVVMALETSVLFPGPAGLGCWPWVVAGTTQTTGHRIMADQRAGL